MTMILTRHACMSSITLAPTMQLVRADTATKLVVAAEPAFDFASAEYLSLHRRSRATAFQGARRLFRSDDAACPRRYGNKARCRGGACVRFRERGISLIASAFACDCVPGRALALRPASGCRRG